MIASTVIIHPNVVLGDNVVIEDYCIIGQQFAGYKGENTIIGDNAVIRAHTIIYAGNQIGKGFQTGNKANIREYNQIGDDVSVGTLTVIEHHVKIGRNVRIHSQAFVPEYSELEDGAWIGPNVVLTNAKYPCSDDVKNQLKGPRIHKNAKLGANVTVLPGIEVGEDSLVGAGSVITKDIPNGVVVIGNPGRILGKVK